MYNDDIEAIEKYLDERKKDDSNLDNLMKKYNNGDRVSPNQAAMLSMFFIPVRSSSPDSMNTEPNKYSTPTSIKILSQQSSEELDKIEKHEDSRQSKTSYDSL